MKRRRQVVQRMKWEDDKALPAFRASDSGEIRFRRTWSAPKISGGLCTADAQTSLGGAGCCHPGTIVVEYEGLDKKRLARVVLRNPSDTNHAVQCGGESACVSLLTSSGPFAILPSTSRGH